MDQNFKNTSKNKATQEQINALRNFIAQFPEMGDINSNDNQWQLLKQHLDPLGNPKTISQWKKSWKDQEKYLLMQQKINVTNCISQLSNTSATQQRTIASTKKHANDFIHANDQYITAPICNATVTAKAVSSQNQETRTNSSSNSQVQFTHIPFKIASHIFVSNVDNTGRIPTSMINQAHTTASTSNNIGTPVQLNRAPIQNYCIINPNGKGASLVGSAAVASSQYECTKNKSATNVIQINPAMTSLVDYEQVNNITLQNEVSSDALTSEFHFQVDSGDILKEGSIQKIVPATGLSTNSNVLKPNNQLLSVDHGAIVKSEKTITFPSNFQTLLRPTIIKSEVLDESATQDSDDDDIAFLGYLLKDDIPNKKLKLDENICNKENEIDCSGKETQKKTFNKQTLSESSSKAVTAMEQHNKVLHELKETIKALNANLNANLSANKNFQVQMLSLLTEIYRLLIPNKPSTSED